TTHFTTRFCFFSCPPLFAAAVLQRLNEMAPEVGLEPTTHRLTADCSTIELLWNSNLPEQGAQYTNRLAHRQVSQRQRDAWFRFRLYGTRRPHNSGRPVACEPIRRIESL